MGGIGYPEIILTGAWYIWWERRQSTHGENVQTPVRSAMSIRVLVTNYWRAKDKTIEKKIDSWSCPPDGFLNINVDAAYDPDLGGLLPESRTTNLL
jgi:hypothetical protein